MISPTSSMRTIATAWRAKLDVICHSTGSLVVRAWLALHARAGLPAAGDGDLSDGPPGLPRSGELRLGPRRSRPVVPRQVSLDLLQLATAPRRLSANPAKPSCRAWSRRAHSNGSCRSTTTSTRRYLLHAHRARRTSAAIRSSLPRATPMAAWRPRLIKHRGLPGTDGTVRIAGTSLNTRACTLDFRPKARS